jgi:hypothetical protein
MLTGNCRTHCGIIDQHEGHCGCPECSCPQAGHDHDGTPDYPPKVPMCGPPRYAGWHRPPRDGDPGQAFPS